MKDIIDFKQEPYKLGFKNLIQKKSLNIVEAGSLVKNRKIVTSKNVDILVGMEKYAEKDSMHHRNAGLTQVLLKEAKQRKIAMGFSFRDFLHSKQRAKLLGRMMQNVRFCRKYKVKLVLASFARSPWEMRHAKDIAAFGRVIGMTGAEVKQALDFKKKRRAVQVIKPN